MTTDDDTEADVQFELQRMRVQNEARRRFKAEQADPGEGHSASRYTDVGALLDGTLPEAPRPKFLTRTDGVPMFYPGEVNLLFGDPEHGKTWVGLAACAEVLAAGGRALVADLDHNGANAILYRLLMLGAPKEVLREEGQFRHCEPGDVADVLQMVTDCAAWSPDVAMVDSTGELLPMFGANSDSSDDFTRIHQQVLQPMADGGAAVLLVDHMAKGRDSRQLGPAGTMAKRRTVGGLSVRVERQRPFTCSSGGSARLLVNKDRHGGVRDHCAALTPAGKVLDEPLVGVFVLDPTKAADPWQIVPPESTEAGEQREFRPTVLMERASRTIEGHPGEFSRDRVAQETMGKKAIVLKAIDLLETEGFVTKAAGQGGHSRYISNKPYREADDPQSPQHLPIPNILTPDAAGVRGGSE